MPYRDPSGNQSIRFSDFTPGIRDNPGANYPPGTAQTTNTNRCIANPGGGLQPLYGRDTIYAGKDWLGANPAGGAYVVSGMFTTGPVIPSGGGGTFSGIAADLILASEYLTGANRVFNLERLRVFETPVTRETLKTVTHADTTADQSGWGITWGVTRSNKAAPTTSPGIPVLVVAWAPSRVGAGGDFFVITVPNDATPTSNTPYTVPTVDASPQICVHQGRIIVHQTTAYGHGTNASWSTSENVRFTDVYNPSVVSAIENFVPENPNGYAFLASMSANELFGLKRTGAVVVTGDIADPLVTNLPMVPGSGDGERPAYSAIGLVYGSRYSGVWLWAHGDGAQHLSPYMNPDFWFIFTGAPAYLGSQYQFDAFERYVLAPNNWIYSIDTQSWWRLDDPSYATIRFFSRFDNYIYGAVQTYTHSALNAVYTWNLSSRSTAYSWTSQPVWAVIDRILEVRGLTLEAKGHGTVTVTTYGRTGAAVVSTFTLADTGFAERIRLNHTNKCLGLQVRIESASGTSVDAPVVYAVDVEYREQEQLSTP